MTRRYYTTTPPRNIPKPPFLMARLFVVTDVKGAHCVESRRMTSKLIAMLPKGALFHGEPEDSWIARLPSEGGGYCYRASVAEVV
jgi:hypothetical protein